MAGRRYSLGILSTHPIQYHSAWFRALAAHPDLDLHVYYCHKASAAEQAHAGFGVEFDWDLPLLEGYSHSFLSNVADSTRRGGFAKYDTPEIKDIIRGRKYDAVLVNGWHYKSAWQAIWACWQANVKVLVRSDSHLHTQRNMAKRAVKSLTYSRFIPRFDACLAVGRWSREYFLHYGAEPAKIFLVPHAVENERFATESARLRPRRKELRKQWGLDEHSIVFMFAGKFIPRKRPLDFVQAIARLARQTTTVEGLMVGDGPLRAECENAVRDSQVPIRFAGFLNQSAITTAYIVADVLVLPSDGGETWGLVVNEAMACGLPCIVSDRVGCGPDLIARNKTGTIYPLGDVYSLAEAMRHMAADPSALGALGARARELIQGYSVHAALGGLLECLTTFAAVETAR
jgi:glycosyltransferase involved in cell wall biosynthesis